VKRVGRIAGVKVGLHWSLIAVVAVVLMGSEGHVAVAAIALVAYVGSLFLHEWGHVLFARWRRAYVDGVELYPLWGLTRIYGVRDPFDHCVIAWGGVLLQAVVGLPMLCWIKLVGYTPFEVLNAFMAFTAVFTVAMIPVNLAPYGRLDGAMAWRLFPMLVERARWRRAQAMRANRWRP